MSRGSLHFYGIGLESDTYAQRKPMPEIWCLIIIFKVVISIITIFSINLLLHIISQHNRQ